MQLIPKGMREIIDEGLGGIVTLDARHRHPSGHRRHIEDITGALVGLGFDTGNELAAAIGKELFLDEGIAPLHTLAEEASEADGIEDMEFEHELNATRGGAGEVVEKENTRIIDEDIDLKTCLETVVMQLLGGRIGGEVLIDSDDAYGELGRELVANGG